MSDTTARQQTVLRRPNGAATAALVLGLLSLVLSVLTGLPAIFVAAVGLARSRSRGSGAVRSAVGLGLGLLSVAVAAVLVQHVVAALDTSGRVSRAASSPVPGATSPAPASAPSASAPTTTAPAPSAAPGGSASAPAPGLAEASGALQQLGVDAASVHCGTPSASLTRVTVDCTGTRLDGGPATIAVACPAADLVGGSATCTATVDGTPQVVRVTLENGVPSISIP